MFYVDEYRRTSNYFANNLLTTIAWKINDEVHYALEGSIFIGGAVVQWLRDGLGMISSSADVETLAAKVQDNRGVYIVPAFAGLARRIGINMPVAPLPDQPGH